MEKGVSLGPLSRPEGGPPPLLAREPDFRQWSRGALAPEILRQAQDDIFSGVCCHVDRSVCIPNSLRGRGLPALGGPLCRAKMILPFHSPPFFSEKSAVSCFYSGGGSCGLKWWGSEAGGEGRDGVGKRWSLYCGLVCGNGGRVAGRSTWHPAGRCRLLCQCCRSQLATFRRAWGSVRFCALDRVRVVRLYNLFRTVVCVTQCSPSSRTALLGDE
jgi:hypothetical protein